MNTNNLKDYECRCLTDHDYVAGEKEVNDLLDKCQMIEAQRDRCMKELDKKGETK